MPNDEQGQLQETGSTSHRKNAIPEGVRWITTRLMEMNEAKVTPRVTRAEFGAARGYDPVNDKRHLENDWSTVSRAVEGALEVLGWKVDRKTAGDESYIEAYKDLTVDMRLVNDQFDLQAQKEEKKTIGHLIAIYLACRKEHFALGGGTTLYHVGLALAELGEFHNFIGTAREVNVSNIALVAYWATLFQQRSTITPPVKAVRIPGGVFDLQLFRYRGTIGFGNVGISVVGADGSYLSGEQALLYGRSSEATEPTNHLLELTADTIICAITSDKLDHKGRKNPSFPLDFSKSQANRKFLVTDKKVAGPIVEALERRQDWTIVTTLNDWTDAGTDLHEFVQKMKEQQNHPISQWKEIKDLRPKSPRPS